MSSGKRPGRLMRRIAERQARKLVEQKQKLSALSRGGSSELPIDVESSSVIDVRAASLPCPLCAGELRIEEHRARSAALREVDVRCALGGGCDDVLLPHTQSLPRLLAAAGLPPTARAAPQPAGLTTPLLPHQRAGLKWMLDREHARDARGVGGLALHPMWVQFVTADEQTFYVHRGRRCRLSSMFYTVDWLAAPTAGGIVCDEMGTGKSLQFLSLVLAAPPPPGWAVEDDDDDAAAAAATDGALPIKTTLIVAPHNLLAQWQAEVETHVARGALTVGTYRGATESARLAAVAARAAEAAAAPRPSDAAPVPPPGPQRGRAPSPLRHRHHPA